MYDRALGCKTTGCFVGAIVVFAFFVYLLNSAQDMVDQAKKTHSPETEPRAGQMTDTGSIGAGSAAEDEATADIINAARLTLLLSAARRYATDHQGQLPPMETPEAVRAALVPRYVDGVGVFQSPRGEKLYLPNPALSKEPLKSFAKPAETIVFYEPLDAAGPESQKRRAVLFLEGNLRSVTPAEWYALRTKAGIP